jgi:hypothetical protein
MHKVVATSQVALAARFFLACCALTSTELAPSQAEWAVVALPCAVANSQKSNDSLELPLCTSAAHHAVLPVSGSQERFHLDSGPTTSPRARPRPLLQTMCLVSASLAAMPRQSPRTAGCITPRFSGTSAMTACACSSSPEGRRSTER